MKIVRRGLLLVAVMLLFASCTAAFIGEGYGSFRIDIGPVANSRTAQPFVSEDLMAVARYEVILTDPDSVQETLVAGSDGMVERHDAKAGAWSVAVAALNADGAVLGRGSGTVDVVAGNITHLAIDVRPSGVGTLGFIIDWTANTLIETSYSAKAYSVASDGSLVELTLTTTGTSASYSASDMPSGNYEIIARIVDHADKTLWGQRESFYVYEGRTTTETFIVAADQMNRRPETPPVFGAVEQAHDFLRIHWTDASMRADQYVIERRSDPGSDWIQICSLSYLATSYKDIDVVQAAAYAYRIKSFNTFGESDWSAERLARVPDTVTVAGGNNILITDTLWTKEHSYLLENVQIENGATLTIEAGTRVRFKINDFDSTRPYYIWVKDGALKVLGTAEEPVVFTTDSSSPYPGAWGYIYFMNGAFDASYDVNGEYIDGSILRNCVIEYARGLKIENSLPYIDGLTLASTRGLDLYGDGDGGYEGKDNASLYIFNNGNPIDVINILNLKVLSATNRAAHIQINKGSVFIKNIEVRNSGVFSCSGDGLITIDNATIMNSFSIYPWWYVGLHDGYGIGIDGLRFQGIGLDITQVARNGLALNGNPSASLSDSSFANCGSWGVSVSSQTDFQMDNVTVATSGGGFYAGSSKVAVVDCDLTGNGTGAQLDSSTGSFTNSTISDSASSALNVNSSIVDIHHNSIVNNRAPVSISFSNSPETALTLNNISNPLALREIKVTDLKNARAKFNYWGTAVETSIQQRIYDYWDTFDVGIVSFAPFLIQAPAVADAVAVPLSPGDGEDRLLTTQTLRWRTIGAADSWRVQVSETADFANSFFNQIVGEESVSIAGLSALKDYCWKVKPISAGVQSELCEIQSFRVESVEALAGERSFYLKLSDDKVLAWGLNAQGQLGYSQDTSVNKTAPVMSSTVYSVAQLSAGYDYCLALRNDGTVWGWGTNNENELGDGAWTVSPRKILNLSGVTAISAGSHHNLALKSDGTVWSWGNNSNGQLGDGTTTQKAIPVKVLGLSGMTAVSAGSAYSLALAGDRTVWSWGSNNYGKLGDGSGVDSLIPVQVQGLTDVVAISAGDDHAVALKSDGTIWAWGYNGDGRVGDGSADNRSSPVQVSGLNGVDAISAGDAFSLALLTDGTVWAWGHGGNGRIGNGSDANQHVAVQVSGLNDVALIQAGSAHSLVMKTDGTLWTWGWGAEGALGNGDTADRLIPVPVTMP